MVGSQNSIQPVEQEAQLMLTTRVTRSIIFIRQFGFVTSFAITEKLICTPSTASASTGRQTLFILTMAVTQPWAKNSLADPMLCCWCFPSLRMIGRYRLHPIVWREEKYWQLVRALPLLSVLWPKISKSTLPVRISQTYVIIENHSGGATRSKKKFDDIFIRFDTTPACDGHVATAIAALLYTSCEQKSSLSNPQGFSFGGLWETEPKLD